MLYVGISYTRPAQHRGVEQRRAFQEGAGPIYLPAAKRVPTTTTRATFKNGTFANPERGRERERASPEHAKHTLSHTKFHGIFSHMPARGVRAHHASIARPPPPSPRSAPLHNVTATQHHSSSTASSASLPAFHTEKSPGSSLTQFLERSVWMDAWLSCSARRMSTGHPLIRKCRCQEIIQRPADV